MSDSNREPKQLISLKEHDERARALYDMFRTGNKRPNGIACPLCGRELIDCSPSCQYLVYPPKTDVECLFCKWKGERIA